MLCLLSFSLATNGCTKADEGTKKQRIRPVLYYEVAPVGGPLERTFAGVSEAGQESNLSFKVSGLVTKIGVQVGDSIKKRGFIAKLDETDLKLRVKQAQASLSSASAQLRNARAAYRRVQALYANQNASRSDLDGARAAFASARAATSAASQSVNLAKQQRAYTKLTAPVTGTIASVLVEVNENVKAGQPIVNLTSGARPKVTVGVPEVLIARVQRGAKVQVRFEAIEDGVFEAEVIEVAVGTNVGNAAYPVTVILAEANKAVRPGMAADVTFRFEPENPDAGPRFVVPASAVGQDAEGRFVFLVERGEEGLGTVARKPVTIAEELTPDGIEILEGVAEGDLVVTAGVSKIEDGMTVKVP